MANRVNVMLDDDAREVIWSLPCGERSRFISRAAVNAASLAQCRDAAERLADPRRGMPAPPKSAEELVRKLRDGAWCACVFDAVYRATAGELGGVLVTADRRFATNVGDDAAVGERFQLSAE